MKKTIHWYEKRGKGSYFDPELIHFIDVPCPGSDEEVSRFKNPPGVQTKLVFALDRKLRKKFLFSIKKKEDCSFSRRYGYAGKVIRGYSVCVRLFNIDIL